jgi:alkanesulfonate monooxygenase SsuD/methylene tetrahydromethanopterin reductase-like flavin-dependent oxidoreductase (luciferase family)
MYMRYGVHAGLQKTSVAELRKIWTAVELCNLDFASVWDHIYAIDFSGPDNLEAVTTHTAMALSTDRIRVGALVYSVGFRGPMLLANAIANIDQMSGGRAEIGIGAGVSGIRNPFPVGGRPPPTTRGTRDLSAAAPAH